MKRFVSVRYARQNIKRAVTSSSASSSQHPVEELAEGNINYGKLSSFEVGNALNVLAKYRQTHTDSWEACLNRAKTFSSTTGHREVAMILNACAKAPYPCRQLAREVMYAYIEKVPRALKNAKTNEIATICNALAKANIRDVELMNELSVALGREMVKKNAGVDCWHVGNIANAYAKLDIRDPLLFNHVLRHAAMVRAHRFHPKDLIQVANAYSKLAFRDTELFDKMADRIHEQVDYFDGRCVSVIAHAYAKLSLGRCLPLFDVLARRLGSVASGCTGQSIANIIAAYSRISVGSQNSIMPSEQEEGVQQKLSPRDYALSVKSESVIEAENLKNEGVLRWQSVFDVMAGQLPRGLPFCGVQSLARISQGLAKVGYLHKNEETRQVLCDAVIESLEVGEGKPQFRDVEGVDGGGVWCPLSLSQISCALPDLSGHAVDSNEHHKRNKKGDLLWKVFGKQVEKHQTDMTGGQLASIALSCATSGRLSPNHPLIRAVLSNMSHPEKIHDWSVPNILTLCRALHIAADGSQEYKVTSVLADSQLADVSNAVIARFLEISWELETLVPALAVQASLDLIFVQEKFKPVNSSSLTSSLSAKSAAASAGVGEVDEEGEGVTVRAGHGDQEELLKNCLTSLCGRLSESVKALAPVDDIASRGAVSDENVQVVGENDDANDENDEFVCLDDGEDVNPTNEPVEEVLTPHERLLADLDLLRVKLGMPKLDSEAQALD